MKSSYGISQYPDAKEIYSQLDNLLSQDIRPIKKEAMDKYLSWFDDNCSDSKEIITEAQKYIPGGVQHNLAFNHPFPLVFTKAEGAWLFDKDGNKYIDFLQAGGPTVLGSNYKPVQEKVIDLIKECGPSTGLFHEYELKLAKEVCRHFPSVDMFRMLGSGTEAVMAAVRIARLATGKKKIIKMGGAYHGWSDQMVYGLRIAGTGRFEAHGIPRATTRHTQEFTPNSLPALERKLRMNKIRGGTAAVILEPIGPESGTRPLDIEFNKSVRELCTKYGALLILDEVVSAFRIGLGGAQGYFDVKPDLTIFGKVIAGGYPSAGGLGGSKDLMAYLAAGIQGAKKRALVGGTMAANPLSSAAGYYTLKEIESQEACQKAGAAGDRLTQGLQDIIKAKSLPYVAYNQGSICHLETTGVMLLKMQLNIPKLLKQVKSRKHMMEEMGAAYMAEGIVTLAGSRMYTSMADTDEIIDEALNRFERVLSKVQQMENSKQKYVLSYDVGTSGTKAVIISTEGEVLGSAKSEYALFYPGPAKVEQNPEDYWSAIKSTTKEVIEKTNISSDEILGLVFTTQAMGIIPVDKSGKVLRPNISWVDGRAEKQALRIMRMLLGKRVFKSLIGIEITGKDVLPKLIWLRENEPEIYANTESILDVNGYLKFMATGKKVFEWSGACSYTFDLKKKDWTRILFRLIGFDLKKLPPLVKSTDKVGVLTEKAALELGLVEGIPVFGGCDDTQSAAMGSGAIHEGEAHIYLGTSAWVGASTARAPKFKNGAVTLQSADPEKNIVVGITEAAGINLDWVIDKFYLEEKKNLGLDRVYEIINQEGERIPAGSDHLILTPWMLGERCPVSTTTTRATFFNLDHKHTRAHVVRAMGEGIAYNLRWIIENFEKDFKFDIPSLRVIGGVSQKDDWMQLIADVTHRRIITTSQPIWAGAIGASAIVMVGAGVYPDFSCMDKFVQTRKEFIPNPDNFEIYEHLFEIYKDLYKALKKTYIKANADRFTKEL